jgi:hypothetical protein
MYCTGQLRSSMNDQSLIKTNVCGFLGGRSNLYSDNQHNRLLTLFTFPCGQVPILDVFRELIESSIDLKNQRKFAIPRDFQSK